jgi:hypothetical protein
LAPSRTGWQELDFDKQGKSVRFSDGEGCDRVIKPMTGDMITAAYPASRAQVRPELAVLCSSLAGQLIIDHQDILGDLISYKMMGKAPLRPPTRSRERD